MLAKLTYTWNTMTGCLACVLVIPYCRSWRWCKPIFHAGLWAGRKQPEKTRGLLKMLDAFTGWETLGGFNRRVSRAGIDTSGEDNLFEAAERVPYTNSAFERFGNGIRRGLRVGWRGFSREPAGEPTTN